MPIAELRRSILHDGFGFGRLRRDLACREIRRNLAVDILCLQLRAIGVDQRFDDGAAEKRDDRHPHQSFLRSVRRRAMIVTTEIASRMRPVTLTSPIAALI